MGIRDLKQNPSKVVELAKSGSDVIITERGTPVARIIPIQRTNLEEMLYSGEVQAPAMSTKSVLESIKPLKLGSEHPNTTQLLAHDRQDRF